MNIRRTIRKFRIQFLGGRERTRADSVRPRNGSFGEVGKLRKGSPGGVVGSASTPKGSGRFLLVYYDPKGSVRFLLVFGASLRDRAVDCCI